MEFQARVVLLSCVFQPYREEEEYQPSIGWKVLRKRKRLFQARASAIWSDQEMLGWSQAICPCNTVGASVPLLSFGVGRIR